MTPKNIRVLTLLALAALCAVLAGCSTTNIAELTKALANDPAAVHVRVTSVYGTVDFTRVGGATNETRTITPDGTITIKQN